MEQINNPQLNKALSNFEKDRENKENKETLFLNKFKKFLQPILVTAFLGLVGKQIYFTESDTQEDVEYSTSERFSERGDSTKVSVESQQRQPEQKIVEAEKAASIILDNISPEVIHKVKKEDVEVLLNLFIQGNKLYGDTEKQDSDAEEIDPALIDVIVEIKQDYHAKNVQMPLIELVKMGIELKDAKKIKDYTRGFLNEKDVLDAVKFLHNEIGLIPTDNLISFVINSDNRDNLHLLVELHKNGFDLNDLKLSTAIFLNFNKIIENPNLINDMVLAERSSDDGAVELLLGPNQFAAYKAWDEPSLDQQADFDKGFAEFRQKNK